MQNILSVQICILNMYVSEALNFVFKHHRLNTHVSLLPPLIPIEKTAEESAGQISKDIRI